MVFRPVGPQPPSVYWVRRLLMLVVVLVVLAVVWWLLPFGSGSGEPTDPNAAGNPSESPSTDITPSTTPTPSHTKTKSKSPTGSPTEEPCADGDIEVTATTDAGSYPANALPVFTLSVATTSAEPCLRDVGQAALELRVSSGGAKVWSSDDCSPGGETHEIVLEPGKPFVQTLTWGRQLSQPGCPSPVEKAAPGEYQLVGRNIEKLSQPDPFTLQ